MIFKLTEEQINEIMQNYGATEKLIKNVEKKLNFLEVIEDEEDYFEIIISVVSQKISNNDQVKLCGSKQEASKKFISLDEFILIELNRKYNDFCDAKEETQQKVKKFVQPKIRHN